MKNLKKLKTTTPLENFLFEMIVRKYTPSVSVTSGVLQYIYFNVEDRSFTIQNGDASMPENELIDINKDEYTSYCDADQKFYECILNKNNMSQRNQYIEKLKTNIKYHQYVVILVIYVILVNLIQLIIIKQIPVI